MSLSNESLYRDGFLESPSRASPSESWEPDVALSGSSSTSSLGATEGPALLEGIACVFGNVVCVGEQSEAVAFETLQKRF